MAQIRIPAWELDRCDIFQRWGHKKHSLMWCMKERKNLGRFWVPGMALTLMGCSRVSQEFLERTE